MKVLITGDREWTDVNTIINEFKQFPSDTIIIHGGCMGADLLCAAVAKSLGFTVREYKAEWDKYGKAAGPIRNQHMIDIEHTLEEPICLCLAFHNSIKSSHGTKDMMKRAKKTKIPTQLITSNA
jgi:hypothetical protein